MQSKGLKIFIGLALLALPCRAQVPATDIFLAPLVGSGDSLRVGEARQITHQPGYDNQPAFLPDSSGLLYTSIRDDGQADTYRYDLASGETTQVTETAESEYSPTPMPDGQRFSVVQVEPDSTQRLWAFPLAGGKPELLLPSIRGIGYHAWGDSVTLGLFVLGEPPTLQIADLRADTAKTVAFNIGRSLHKIPGEAAISFVQKTSDSIWVIVKYDLQTGVQTPLVPTLAGSEYYCWTPDGMLLMGKGSELLAVRPGEKKAWKPIADFAGMGMTSITRLAVSPDNRWLAFVALQRAEK